LGSGKGAKPSTASKIRQKAEIAVALEATLLVMGGFTRSRVPGFLLGGVTRHVLENPAIPVLMAH